MDFGCPKVNNFRGMIKFFRNKYHLEQFLDGYIYCNTPEYYRCSQAKGISDRNDSCMFSVRECRNDSPCTLEMEGKFVGKVSDMLVRNGRKDGWLHCWVILSLPVDDISFNQLKEDITVLKSEFGPHYVFVNAKNSHIMANRIKKGVSVDVEANAVTYFNSAYFGNSVFFKSNKFSYQREFRFILGQCSNDCNTSKVWHIEGGFRDIVENSPKIKLTAHSEESYFELVLENA